MSDYDVIVIGGGPAGSVVASLLAPLGRRVLLVERDIHPRDHIGESLTPSTNAIWEKIGFLDKIEAAGFVRKPGAAWTAPTTRPGAWLEIRLAEFPIEGATQAYTYNVERDVFDAMLLRHAAERGAQVLEGARVEKVLFDGDRATGVRVKIADGWERDVSAEVIVDASGRRCLLASQLRLKTKDDFFNQFGAYAWFRDVAPTPPGMEGMLWLDFVGLERAWAWRIPLRNGNWSVGVVTDRADWREAGQTIDEFAWSVLNRNRSMRAFLDGAVQTRPWRTEGDYSYKVSKLTGKGWLLVGDALRFVDPVFSTGVDVATYSALYAAEAIDAALGGGDEEALFRAFERRVTDGVDAWYDLIKLFYKLQNLFTFFAMRGRYRESVVRILQGNLYLPESLERARKLITVMEEAHDRVMANPNHLLRPHAFSSLPSA